MSNLQKIKIAVISLTIIIASLVFSKYKNKENTHNAIVYKSFPFNAYDAKERQQETGKLINFPIQKTISLYDKQFDMILIPAGEFMRGSKYTPVEAAKLGSGKFNHFQDEHPRRRVILTRPYYIGKYEVTQEVWQKVMDSNPSKVKNPKNPVDSVSWFDCQKFIKKLNKLLGFEGKIKFRLPTEAEWENACRAGKETPFYFGENITTKLANYKGTIGWRGMKGIFRGKTLPVGKFPPNYWGIYDTHGNVREWCYDWYDRMYYKKSSIVNPTGPTSGDMRVLRGGGYSTKASHCRSAARYYGDPKINNYRENGFRLCLDVK